MSHRRKHKGAGAGRGGRGSVKALSHQVRPPEVDSHQQKVREGILAPGVGVWRDWIAAKRPVWRFTVLLFAGLAVFYVGYALFSASRYLEPLLRLIASISAAVLSTLGYEARADGAVVTGPAFAFQVVRGCDGLEPVGFLLAAALATPTPVRTRCLFAFVGGVFLLALNLMRLVSMALVDVYFPRLTEAMHVNAWPAVTIVVVALLWVCWVRRIRLTGHVFG